MALYEVKVERVSTVYYDIDAENELEARNNFTEGIQTAEFIERELILSVDYDADLDYEDATELIDEYEIEQEETDE